MLDDCRRPQVRSVKVRMQTAQHIGVAWWTMGVLSLWNLSVYSDSDSVNMWHGYGCVHLFTYKSPFNFPRSQPYWGVFRNCCGGKAWSTQGTRELQALTVTRLICWPYITSWLSVVYWPVRPYYGIGPHLLQESRVKLGAAGLCLEHLGAVVVYLVNW